MEKQEKQEKQGISFMKYLSEIVDGLNLYPNSEENENEEE